MIGQNPDIGNGARPDEPPLLERMSAFPPRISHAAGVEAIG
jgi:hypothetical protein